MIQRVPVCVACVVTLTLIVGCSEKIDTFEEYREVALRHERDGELTEAIVAYKKALELQPSAAATWYDLGVTHFQLDQIEEAQAAYTKAIELDPTMAIAYNNRATVWAVQQQFERAIEDYSRSIALDPRNALALRNRGLAHFDLGQFQAARENYAASLHIDDSDSSTWLYRGNALLELGRWEQALNDFDSALERDDALPNAWLNRARALVELGRPDEARKSAERAESLGADLSQFSFEPRGMSSESASVDAVRIWLKERDRTADRARFPWDLKVSNGEQEVRYLVREITREGNLPAIHFLQEELDALKAADGIRTTLVIVEDRSTDDHSADWNVVQVLDDWQPDFDVLQPRSWSLPVEPLNPDASP